MRTSECCRLSLGDLILMLGRARLPTERHHNGLSVNLEGTIEPKVETTHSFRIEPTSSVEMVEESLILARSEEV